MCLCRGRFLNFLKSDSAGGKESNYLHVFLICGSYNFDLAQTESNVQPAQITKLQSWQGQYLE